MEALMIAMYEHGIPRNRTLRFAKLLGIKSIKDIRSNPTFDIKRVPKRWRKQILNMCNAYKDDDDTDWTEYGDY